MFEIRENNETYVIEFNKNIEKVISQKVKTTTKWQKYNTN